MEESGDERVREWRKREKGEGEGVGEIEGEEEGGRGKINFTQTKFGRKSTYAMSFLIAVIF